MERCGNPEAAAEYDWPDMAGRSLGDRATVARAADVVCIRPRAHLDSAGWFYHADQQPKSLDRLIQIYEQTCGRNSTLILNTPPDKRGLFADQDVAALKAFGEKARHPLQQQCRRGLHRDATSSLPGHPASAALDGKYETYWEAAPKRMPTRRSRWTSPCPA